ncbi:MAG: hypothetical protein ABGX26_02190 [Nautiliaceae bacterium]
MGLEVVMKENYKIILFIFLLFLLLPFFRFLMFKLFGFLGPGAFGFGCCGCRRFF